MGDKTGISWTRSDDGAAGATWNPVTGCDLVSDGCTHCYAKTVSLRFPNAYPNGFELTLVPQRLNKPLQWARGRMVFVNSMSDLFHKDVPDWYIAQVFAVMAATPRHTYQILTKRPGRMRSLLTSDRVIQATVGWGNFEDMVRSAYISLKNNMGRLNPDDAPRGMKEILGWPKHDEFEWPLKNVWLGTSVESQKWADVRIPQLLDTPAAVRFLSMEPLLGPVDLKLGATVYETAPLHGSCDCGSCDDHPLFTYGYGPAIDWVIVGGESGKDARPMHPDWVRNLRDQCFTANVPFWFKQYGEWLEVPVEEGRDGDQWLLGDIEQVLWPYPWHESNPPMRGADAGRWGPYRDVLLRRVGKNAAGNTLDGFITEQRPAVA